MIKEAQQSLLDYLQTVMPELQDLTIVVKKSPQDSPEAEALYDLWSDVESKVTARQFVRPPSLSQSVIDRLEHSGLVQSQGKYLKVTSKGADTIKHMILHKEKSIFNKSAKSKTLTKTAMTQQSANSSNWYCRAKNG